VTNPTTASSEGLRLPTKRVLTLDAAMQVVAAARAEAIRRDLRLTIAVVDDGGHPLHLVRMDGVHAGTVDVAIAKARTAVLFKKPTQAFAESLAGGASAILALPGMLPLPGGIPLFQDGGLIGAIGVSGAAPDVDAAVAAAGADLIPSHGDSQ
jgi:uncharacterized protein GlcG (DUF336 family)